MKEIKFNEVMMKAVWLVFLCFAIGTSNGKPKGSSGEIDPKTGLMCNGKCKDDSVSSNKRNKLVTEINTLMKDLQEKSKKLKEMDGKSTSADLEKSLLVPQHNLCQWLQNFLPPTQMNVFLFAGSSDNYYEVFFSFYSSCGQ